MSKWYDEMSAHQEVFISSKIELSRNLKAFHFTTKLTDEEAEQLVTTVASVGDKIAALNPDKKLLSCRISELSDFERNALIERDALSLEFLKKRQHTGLFLSEDESFGMMINGKDHIRLRVTHSGMCLENVWKEISAIDDKISENLEYAFDEKLGYLTACPTDVGTGMRASYLLFLPALTANGKIPQITSEISKYGITLRGAFGENGASLGGMYQMSNQKTLGYSEVELMESLNRIACQVEKQEKQNREYILSSKYDEVENRVYRVYGMLKYARSINSTESMELLADLKFAVDTNLIRFESKVNIFQMMLAIKPCCIQWKLSRTVGKVMRDRIRAEYIRTHLPELKEDINS